MKNEKKLIALEIAVFAAFILTVAVSSFYSLDKTCDNIKENVLRLHVIANSDSEEDQKLKLAVRDAVLSAGSPLFDGEVNTKNAAEIAKSETEYLEQAAQAVIDEQGLDYGVKIEVGKSRFPTRVYEDVTLPAGEYTAVRVILGKGEGHNWWCVMFPPMCLSAAEGETTLSDVLSQDALELTRSGKKYEVKFKLIEWYENIKAAINDRVQKAE
ncbi:MAG: stage II sporulation protein R [Acutalibacteraceae bacterium]